MNRDKENLAQARRLVGQATSQSCLAFNTLCKTQYCDKAYDILEGQLRIAEKLAKLEGEIIGE